MAIVHLQGDLHQVAIVLLQEDLHQAATVHHLRPVVTVLHPLSQVMGVYPSPVMEEVRHREHLKENFQPLLKYSMGDLAL